MVNAQFFEQHTVEVARQLLGCLLVRRWDGQELIVRITETEAYRGADDPASHAHRGMTPRNRPMFGPAGRLYVYFTYGMHYCMNIVTEPEHQPGAVLLRGAEIVKGQETVRRLRGPKVKDNDLLNGPGKLTQGLYIGAEYNGYDLLGGGDALAILPRTGHVAYRATERIGISKAKDYKWRFIVD